MPPLRLCSRCVAALLTKDEARRIAANIAKRNGGRLAFHKPRSASESAATKARRAKK
jgi:hypothetical protein